MRTCSRSASLNLRVALLAATFLTLGAVSPSPVQAARLAGGAPWVPLFESDFTANTSAGWPIARANSYDESIAGGRYTLSVADGQTHLEGPRPPLLLADGLVTAVVRLVGRGQVGLAARIDQTVQEGYVFWIDGEGRCGATRFADGTQTALFAVYDNAIVRGGDNVLTIQAVGGQLTFVVNSRPVYSYVDPTPLPAGTWGMYVGSAPDDGTARGQYARIMIDGAAQAPHRPTLSAYPFTPLVDYDFSAGNNNSWYTSHYEHTSAVIAHGRLTISAIGGYKLIVTPRQFPDLANGQIAAVVRLRGAGRVGVAGRWTDNPDGYYTDYACWIDQSGDVGLDRENDGNNATVFETLSDRAHPFRDTTIALRIQGNHIGCFVNNQRMVVYTDRHPFRAGGWGAWVNDYPGGAYAQGQYAHILIAD